MEEQFSKTYLANLAKSGYPKYMRTVNIGELKNQLSGYLQYVKNGEEIVIRDRSVPVARILPFRHGSGWEQEEQLVASGALKMPEDAGRGDELESVLPRSCRQCLTRDCR